MKRIISIVSVILIISSLFCFTVSAENSDTYELFQKQKVTTTGNICTFEYYIPDSNYQFAMIISRCQYVTDNHVGYRLVFYEAGTEFKYDSSYRMWYADKEFAYLDFNTLEEAKEELFSGKTPKDYTIATNLGGSTMGSVFVYQEVMYSNGSNESLESAYYNWHYETYGEYPTIQEDEPEEENTSGFLSNIFGAIGELIDTMGNWFNTLVETVKALPDRIAEFFSLDIVIDEDTGKSLHIGEYMFQVVENRINTGTLSEGDGEFYNTVFYFGQRFNAFLRQDFSQPPDMELLTVDLSKNESSLPLGNEKVSLMDLSWYGRYKPMVDGFLSCFLWMGFIFMLWRNLPNFVSGQGAGFSDSYTGYVKLDENIHGKTTVTRTVTVNNKTGKTMDTTAISNRKRGK